MLPKTQLLGRGKETKYEVTPIFILICSQASVLARILLLSLLDLHRVGPRIGSRARSRVRTKTSESRGQRRLLLLLLLMPLNKSHVKQRAKKKKKRYVGSTVSGRTHFVLALHDRSSAARSKRRGGARIDRDGGRDHRRTQRSH